jgi:hypothetical protein
LRPPRPSDALAKPANGGEAKAKLPAPQAQLSLAVTR